MIIVAVLAAGGFLILLALAIRFETTTFQYEGILPAIKELLR
jgi:hypothetical protein